MKCMYIWVESIYDGLVTLPVFRSFRGDDKSNGSSFDGKLFSQEHSNSKLFKQGPAEVNNQDTNLAIVWNQEEVWDVYTLVTRPRFAKMIIISFIIII